MIWVCLLVFLSGFLYESSCVFWTHFAERDQAIKTALVSMLIAISQIVGIGGSLQDWRIAIFFVLGYGAGTYFSILVKRKLKG